MRIVVVTLFPELVTQALAFGVLGRAVARDVLTVETIDPRQFAIDLHRTVDDRPYGGGPGYGGAASSRSAPPSSAPRSALPSSSPPVVPSSD